MRNNTFVNYLSDYPNAELVLTAVRLFTRLVVQKVHVRFTEDNGHE